MFQRVPTYSVTDERIRLNRKLAFLTVVFDSVLAEARAYPSSCQGCTMNRAQRCSLTVSYTPFGYSSPTNPVCSLLGFDGKFRQLSGFYLLGNGYRSYGPLLMRFCSPDNLSPFGGGGINAYSYCFNDPVNYSDSSGHMPKIVRKQSSERHLGMAQSSKSVKKADKKPPKKMLGGPDTLDILRGIAKATPDHGATFAKLKDFKNNSSLAYSDFPVKDESGKISMKGIKQRFRRFIESEVDVFETSRALRVAPSEYLHAFTLDEGYAEQVGKLADERARIRLAAADEI
ncbi:hypothetical protein CR511_14585 [Pseudomonas putida]|nr:hypothetical protein CR511_14585 [Pseudomonas putida]